MVSERPSISKRVRFGISFLIIGHLLAVVLPPLSLQTQGPIGQSPSVATALQSIEGYSQMVYLDRGYAFFAPDPGPSHLIQAAITESDGSKVELMFPDRKQQWPRLLYHRHFMLSEFMEEIYQPPGPPADLMEANPDQAEFWSANRSRYTKVRQSVIDHLSAEYPGREVAIRRIEHLIPDLLDYQQEPVALNDERLYRVMLDVPPESAQADETATETPKANAEKTSAGIAGGQSR